MPAAKGAAAEVPVCLSVQPVPVPRRQSVVTWEKKHHNQHQILIVNRSEHISQSLQFHI